MPGDTCPIVQSYIDEAKEYFRSLDPAGSGLYSVPSDKLDELTDLSLAQKSDESTQLLRGFYCLHGLYTILKGRPGYKDYPEHKLPLTREGVRKLHQECMDFKRETEVGLYVSQLIGKEDDATAQKRWELTKKTNVDLADVIITACEHLRPRIRRAGSLSRMGKLYVQGMKTISVPSDSVIAHGRALVNVAIIHQGQGK